MNAPITEEYEIVNCNDEKIGVAVWTGNWEDNRYKVDWEVYNLADHLVATVKYLGSAHDTLEGIA